MPQTHPCHLATIAWLLGMNPAPLAEARVLELGCGDGGNLVPMALGMPGARFVGLDLSGTAIRRGRNLVGALGLANVSLRVQDLAEDPGDLGMFDFIICHGVYSWVPPEVGERILALIQARLAPQGVAFVSYNTLPGGYLHKVVNDLMRYHTRGMEDPEVRMQQAMAIVEFMADGALEGSGVYRAVLREECDRLHRADSESCLANHLVHDRLHPAVRTPYFHEFMERCDAHGLDYLGEADFQETQDQFLPEPVRKVLVQVAGGRIRVREQMLDFLKGRKFRQTLLCRAGTTVDRRLDPAKVMQALAATPVIPLNEAGQPLPGGWDAWEHAGELTFGKSGGRSNLTTAHPAVCRALAFLGTRWPMPFPFNAIMDAVGRMGGPTGAEDRRAVSEGLLAAFCGGLAEIHRETPRFARSAGARPVASPLVRLQLREGPLVTSLTHRTVNLNDICSRVLLPLMDGQRDRITLLREATAAMRGEGVALDGRALPDRSDAEIEAEIVAELDRLTRYGLLMAEAE